MARFKPLGSEHQGMCPAAAQVRSATPAKLKYQPAVAVRSVCFLGMPGEH